MSNRCFTTKRYAQKGDSKPRQFQVGDLFAYANGETAIVTEVFDRYKGESKYGPEWTLHLKWFPGRGESIENKNQYHNEQHGAMRTNMFNQLCIAKGNHWYSAKR